MGDGIERRSVGATEVEGLDVDPETRCRHYATECDVLAIRFYCCGTYYPCYECHAACTGHPAEVWPRTAFDCQAILCGVCGTELSIETYLAAEDACPICGAAFNPNCRLHYDRYFETPSE